MKLLKISLVCSLLFTTSAFAEKVVVIVNADNNQALSTSDIKNIYSDNIINWSNGDRIKSYDLPVKKAEREVFSEKVMGMSAADVAKEWANRKITNTAKNPPKTTQEVLVVSNVAKDKNAIGYVPAEAADGKDGIKVILTLE